LRREEQVNFFAAAAFGSLSVDPQQTDNAVYVKADIGPTADGRH
jgi:hypothetical protein